MLFKIKERRKTLRAASSRLAAMAGTDTHSSRTRINVMMTIKCIAMLL